jgi:hypothetical protein
MRNYERKGVRVQNTPTFRAFSFDFKKKEKEKIGQLVNKLVYFLRVLKVRQVRGKLVNERDEKY